MKYNPKIVLAYFKEVGLPKPEVEYVFLPNRKFRFDFAWPQQKVALEVEGGVFIRGAHGSVSGILRDLQKYNLAACAGWRVLRTLPENLCTNCTVCQLELCLESTP